MFMIKRQEFHEAWDNLTQNIFDLRQYFVVFKFLSYM